MSKKIKQEGVLLERIKFDKGIGSDLHVETEITLNETGGIKSVKTIKVISKGKNINFKIV